MLWRLRHVSLFALLVAATGCQDQLVNPSMPLSAAKGGKPKPPCDGLPDGTSILIIAPQSADIVVGETLQLSVTNGSGTEVPACALKWASSNSALATVSAEGIVAGVAVGGPVTIKAQTSGKKPLQATASITIIAFAPVASVEVSPGSASRAPGETVQLTVLLKDANGNELTGREVAWTSSHDGIATVSAGGLVTAIMGGDATITATSEGQSGTSAIRVAGWVKLTDGPVQPSMQVITTSTYDATNRAVYVVREQDYDNTQPQIWRYDLPAGTWNQLSHSGLPSGKYRQYQFDPSGGGRILTFWDGLGSAYALGRDGGSWASLGGGGSGSEFYEGGSFIDPITGRLSLLMGYGGSTYRNTFWQLDGSSWVLQTTTNTPPARMRPRLATDPSGSRVFMVGGDRKSAPSGSHFDDIWSLDLVTRAWTNLVPTDQGPGVISPFAGFVSSLNRLYIYGGERIDAAGALTGQDSDQLWYHALGTAGVTAVSVAGATPGPRRSGDVLSAGGSQFYYDAPDRRLILAGGLDAGDYWHMDVWAYYLP